MNNILKYMKNYNLKVYEKNSKYIIFKVKIIYTLNLLNTNIIINYY